MGAFNIYNMAKDAYYFSHDSNAKDDPKCMLVIDQLGLEGYGIYWVLIEVLRDQPNFSYPMKLVPILARRYNTTAEKMMTVIQKYGLFELNPEEEFFSLSLNKRMEKLETSREQRRLAGKSSAEKRKLLQASSTNVQRPLDECSTSKVKESKVKESIEDRKNKLELKFRDRALKFTEKYPVELINAFCDYWTEGSDKNNLLRFESERFFDMGRRLATWNRNNLKFSNSNNTQTTAQQNKPKGAMI